MRALAPALMVAALLVAGCHHDAAVTGGSSPSSSGAPEERLVGRADDLRQTAPDIPSLKQLKWQRLQKGDRVGFWSIVITDAQAAAVLSLPSSSLEAAYLKLIDGGNVEDYEHAGQIVTLHVKPQLFLPLAPRPGEFKAKAVTFTANRVEGLVLVSTQSDVIRQNFNERPISLVSAASPGAKGRPRVGMTGAEVDARLVAELRLPSTDGVYVKGIQPGSPAEASGLQQSDVIARVDNTDIHTPIDLENLLHAARPGQTLKLHVFRSSAQAYLDLPLTVGEK